VIEQPPRHRLFFAERSGCSEDRQERCAIVLLSGRSESFRARSVEDSSDELD